jgi:hypothetical protein
VIAAMIDDIEGASLSVSPSTFAVQLRPEESACTYPRD